MRIKIFFRKKIVRNMCLFAALLLLALSISYCGFVFNDTKIISQPSTANAGETITVQLQTRLTTDQVSYTNSRLVVGVLVPKSWQGDINNNIVATYTSPRDGVTNVQTMSVIPDNVTPVGYTNTSWSQAMQQQAGLLGNLLPDLEWVPFWSDKIYQQSSYDTIYPINFTLKIKTGPQNTLVKLGYVISASADGLDITNSSNNAFLPLTTNDCFSAINGTNPLVDFCNPQLTTINPLEALDNDIITLVFDKNIDSTILNDEENIFMCATAYDATGAVLDEVCTQEQKSKLTPIGSGQYKLEFWPRKYFNITPDQTINYINYYLTNATGDKKLGRTDNSPLSIQFNCN